MTNKKPALSASVLAAVGLAACEPKVVACLSAIDTELIDTDLWTSCLDTDVVRHSDTESWGPCLDLAPTADTGRLTPCLTPAPDTDTDSWAPCLDLAPTGRDTGPHTGPGDAHTDTWGPCLDFVDSWTHTDDTDPPRETWGCLDTAPAWPDSDDTSPHTGGPDVETACLDSWSPVPTADTSPDLDTDDPDTAATVVVADTAAPPPRSAAIRSVLQSTDLPPDVAAALARRTEEP